MKSTILYFSFKAMRLIWLGLFLLSLSACFPPINSTFESARTLGNNKMDLTGNYSAYTAHNDGESEQVSNNLGIRLGFGITERFDIKMRYERISLSGEGTGLNYLELSPKVSLIRNKIAAILPLGLYFDEEGHAFVLSPKFIYTYPANTKFDISFSTKADIFLEKDVDDILLGFNIGFGLSTDLEKWAVRPEFGLMINPGEDGSLLTFGIGFNYILSTNTTK